MNRRGKIGNGGSWEERSDQGDVAALRRVGQALLLSPPAQLLGNHEKCLFLLQNGEFVLAILLEQGKVVEPGLDRLLQILQGERDALLPFFAAASRRTASHEAGGEVRFARQARGDGSQRAGGPCGGPVPVERQKRFRRAPMSLS